MVEPLPSKTPEGKPIIYYQPSKSKSTGVFLVDPITRTRGQSVFLEDLKIGKDTELRQYIADPQVEASRRARVEKKEAREMALKREEVSGEVPPKSPSETWEQYIGKYGSRAKVTSSQVARQYQKQLQEPEEVKPTTREEFQREILRKQRIVATTEKIQQKQAQEGDTFPASEKFVKLYQQRQPEIKEMLGREAWTRWAENIQAERTKAKFLEEERIEPYTRIIEMKPGIEKAKRYFPALIKKAPEMEEARVVLKRKAILAGDTKREWMLTALKPATQPKGTAVAFGLATIPILRAGKLVPVLGKAITSKKAGYTLASLYGLGKTSELSAKVKADPFYYDRPSGKIELALDPITEVGSFGVGAKASSLALRTPGAIKTKIAERKLSKLVKGKPVSQVKDIITKPTLALTLSERGISPDIRVRVKELEGFKAKRDIQVKGGKLTYKGVYEPQFKKRTIPIEELQQPKAVKIQYKGTTIGKAIPPKTKAPLKSKALTIKSVSKPADLLFEGAAKGEITVATKGMKQFALKREIKKQLPTTAKGKFRQVGLAKGKFVGTDVPTMYPLRDPALSSNLLGLEYKPIKGIPRKGTFKDVSPKRVGFEYKITYPKEYIAKPIITESGVALGTLRYYWRTGKTVSRGVPIPEPKRPRFVSMGLKRIDKPPSGIETRSGRQGLILKPPRVEKLKVVTGVRLKQAPPRQEQATRRIFATATRQEQKQEQRQKKKRKTRQTQQQYYKTVQEQFSPQAKRSRTKTEHKVSDILSQRKSSFLERLVGRTSISTSALSKSLGISQAQAKGVAQAQAVSQSQAKQQAQAQQQVRQQQQTQQQLKQLQRIQPLKPIFPTTPRVPRRPPRKPPKVPGALPSFGLPKLKLKGKKKKKGRAPSSPSYTPTLVGIEFLPRIKATKALSQFPATGLAPRPLAVPKGRGAA